MLLLLSMCNPHTAAAFHRSVPKILTTKASPWYSYLTAVYGTAPILPFKLGELSLFYHYDDDARARRREHRRVK